MFDSLTTIYVATAVLVTAAASSLVLGGVVLRSNARRLAHRVFALLMFNLALWALGVVAIVHCMNVDMATMAIRATFIVACFLPANFVWFVSEFPYRRRQGTNYVLLVLYLAGIALSGLSFTSEYLHEVRVFANRAPQPVYGPVFNAYPVLVLIAMAWTLRDLISKLRVAHGLERRQVQYVLVGIFASTIAASFTNVIAPVVGLESTEIYGPCFVVIMAAFFTYAMVRYHMLDVWILFSRATVYATVMAFVTVTFMASVSVVHWLTLSVGVQSNLISSLIAALVVALLVQPVKERVQLLLDRLLLHRHYDSAALIERIGRKASAFVELDPVLTGVAEEIAQATGASSVWFTVTSEHGDRSVGRTYVYPGESEFELSPEDGLAMHEYLAECGYSFIALDREGDESNRGLGEILPKLRALPAVMIVPLRSSSGFVGALILGEKRTRDMYDLADTRVFRAVSSPLATAIENARLYQRLEKLNLRLNRIVGSMRAGIVAVDAEGRVTTVNEEARALLGRITQQNTLDQVHPKVQALLRQTLTSRRGIADVETVITTPDDDQVPIAMSSSHLVTGEGTTIGAMVLVFNMTQIKMLESSVQRADRLTSIGTMAAGMAHEIKNPLQSIKTFTQLLPKRYEDPDFRKTFSEVVPPEVQRIDDIVTQLLDFARPKPAMFERQDLASVISDVLALVANQIKKRDIDLVMKIPPDLPPLVGDTHQLKQVFLNLFLNAIDAMRDRPERRLYVKLSEGFGRLSENAQGGLDQTPSIRITVTDTGCGIPQDNIGQLFNPFFTTKDNGSGLGLSVVHSIIEEHGGEISVTSESDVGTTFNVMLPRLPATAPVETVRS